MPDLADARRARADHALVVGAARERLAVATRALLEATETAEAAGTPDAREALEAARALERQYDSELRAILADGVLPPMLAISPEDAVGMLEPGFPIALLPVRVETRFAQSGPAWELLVRVYPDDVHIDTHESELTLDEQQAGVAFWSATGDGPGIAAWAQLAERYGANRAAWIRRATHAGAAPPALRRAPWTRPPQAGGLPDHFLFQAYRGDTALPLVAGKPVVRPLAVGPDPQVKTGKGPAGVDEATMWKVRFDAAEDAGMAVRIPLGSAPGKIDRLIVVGVAGSLTPQSAAAELARVLTAHRHTAGLGLLPAGTPTNAGERPSGYTGSEDHASTYVRECGPSPARPHTEDTAEIARAAATDGARLATGLGIPLDVLATVDHTGEVSEVDQRAMFTALWPGTLGYALRQFLGASFDGDDQAALREHALGFVRPRGPFASLRVGAQPYGVLPTTSLARYEPPSGSARAVRFLALLKRFEALWDKAAKNVPKLGTGNPEQTLAEILASSPLSTAIKGRLALSTGHLVTLGALAALSVRQRSTLIDLQVTLAALGSQDVATLARDDGLLQIVNGDGARWLDLPLVQATPVSPDQPLVENYISFLRTATTDEVIASEERFGSPLLFLIMRFAVLHQYLRLWAAVGRRDPREILDKFMIIEDLPGFDGRSNPLELLRLPTGPDLGGPLVDPLIRTIATRQLGRGNLLLETSGFGRVFDLSGPVGIGPIDIGPIEIGPIVVEPFDIDIARGPFIGGERTAIGRIPFAGGAIPFEGGEIPFEGGERRGGGPPLPRARERAAPISPPPSGPPQTRAERETAEVLAALAHLESRPSAALHRLLRETLDLGAHRLDAWTTSLATERLSSFRARDAASASGVHLGAYGWVDDLSPAEPPHAVPDDHLPEVARPLVRDAAGAGFVHAPSLAHAATAGILQSAHLAHDRSAAFAFDLSSRRVRVATWLLEGEAAGQPLGALLGYLLERALHDRKADHFIAPLRDVAPLARTRLGTADAPSETIAAHDVVDGLNLLERLNAVPDAGPPITIAELTDSAADGDKLEGALNELRDTADAVADLRLAEAVHQLGSGSRERAAAALRGAAGAPLYPDLDVVRSHRSATSVAHRLLLLHHGTPADDGDGWTRTGPRAVLDPHIERLVAAQLPAPDAVTVVVRWHDPDDGAELGNATVALRALGLSALDVVLAAKPAVPGERGELEQRFADLAARPADAGGLRPAAVPPAAVELDVDAGAAGTLPLGALLELASALRTTLGHARPLAPEDLRLSGVPASAEANLVELDARLGAARARVADVRSALDAVLVAPPSSVTAAAVRAALRAAADCALPSAWPQTADGESERDRADLMRQAEAARDELDARLSGTPAGSGVDARRSAGRRLLGEEQPVAPGLGGDAAAALCAALGAPPAGADGSTLRSLLAQLAAVRPAVGAFCHATECVTAAGATAPAPALAQFPTGGPWAGAPGPAAPGGAAVPGGRIVIVAVEPALTGKRGEPLSGMVIDAWQQDVPRPEETTALSVHADRPGAEAPHAVLLAVPPTRAGTWDVATLIEIVGETLDRARRRMVDLPALDGGGQIVPLLYLTSTTFVREGGLPTIAEIQQRLLLNR